MSMPCLSIHQPYAYLIAAGIKDIENRSWRPKSIKTPFTLLIHASKGRGTKLEIKKIRDRFTHETAPALLKHPRPGELPAGAIIGQVTVSKIIDDSTSPWAQPFGWHWVLTNALEFHEPIPYPGRQRLFRAPEPNAQGLFRVHDGTTRRVCLRVEPAEVIITRQGGKWGNPYEVVRGQWAEEWTVQPATDGPSVVFNNKAAATRWACQLYESHVRRSPELMAALHELKGRRLGCFCAAGDPCHGDVLVRLVKEFCK